jgi:hypothetical protein
LPAQNHPHLNDATGWKRLASSDALDRILEEKGIKPAGDADEENLAELARLSKVP